MLEIFMNAVFEVMYVCASDVEALCSHSTKDLFYCSLLVLVKRSCKFM